MRSGNDECEQSSVRCQGYVSNNQQPPFELPEHCVKDKKDQQNSKRHDNQKPGFRAFLAFVFSFPVHAISAWELYLCVNLLNRFFNSSAQVTPANTVFDGNVTLILLTVDFRSAITLFDVAELCERYPFARG